MSSAYFCRIDGYEPRWLVGVDNVERTHRRSLQGLVGSTLTRVWLLEDRDGSWWADAPVILDFDGITLEVCHNKFDEVSLTFGTVEPDRPVPSYEPGAPPLRWRTDLDVGFGAAVGRRLRSVALLELASPAADLANGTVSIHFEFADARFTVFNALDENGVTTEPPNPHHLARRV